MEGARIQVGAIIADKYRLIRVIGSGGMGIVYEAQHEVTLRKVAVKMIHGWVLDASSASGARFLREARAAAAIEHPAIVEVLDAGNLPEGNLYLVFELLEGVELGEAVHHGALKTQDIVEIAGEVLDGLSAAHKSGFIHRDIKPANVFLAKRRSGKREVKLLDFGISKHIGLAAAGVQSVTAQGSIVGTLDYMAPEQALGQTIDARADIWSVGAVLFQCFTREAPFIAEKDLELIDKIVRGPIPSLAARRPDLPKAIVAVVERALERNLSRRWQSAAQMREAILACGQAEPDDRGADLRARLQRSISGVPTQLINVPILEPDVRDRPTPRDRSRILAHLDELDDPVSGSVHIEEQPTELADYEELPDDMQLVVRARPRDSSSGLTEIDAKALPPLRRPSSDGGGFLEDATATTVDPRRSQLQAPPRMVTVSDWEISDPDGVETEDVVSHNEHARPVVRAPRTPEVIRTIVPAGGDEAPAPPVVRAPPFDTAPYARAPDTAPPQSPRSAPMQTPLEPRSSPSTTLFLVLAAGLALAFLAYLVVAWQR